MSSVMLIEGGVLDLCAVCAAFCQCVTGMSRCIAGVSASIAGSESPCSELLMFAWDWVVSRPGVDGGFEG